MTTLPLTSHFQLCYTHWGSDVRYYFHLDGNEPILWSLKPQKAQVQKDRSLLILISCSELPLVHPWSYNGCSPPVLSIRLVADDSMKLLKVTEAFDPRAKCQREGVTASLTQPLEATSDLATWIPIVILGAEVLGLEAGFVCLMHLWKIANSMGVPALSMMPISSIHKLKLSE
ncbi:hypothetical protein Cgig2_030148 [Carnegiea gigantea]|uniref:Uncharacterized protein n=1 Tax=Carnegiea gigantea TaxID=171969 RepID=A0A9Q1K0I7_9CARY|nr:hypothetical protein Cgig2_030148 [Carnegiea gigantea]